MYIVENYNKIVVLFLFAFKKLCARGNYPISPRITVLIDNKCILLLQLLAKQDFLTLNNKNINLNYYYVYTYVFILKKHTLHKILKVYFLK